MSSSERLRKLALGCCLVFAAGCSRVDSAATAATTVRITGSDTMVNLVQAWAENYRSEAA